MTVPGVQPSVPRSDGGELCRCGFLCGDGCQPVPGAGFSAATGRAVSGAGFSGQCPARIAPDNRPVLIRANTEKAKRATTKVARFRYSERESNPHDHCWSQDFKSGVSTYSTIRATHAFSAKGDGKSTQYSPILQALAAFASAKKTRTPAAATVRPPIFRQPMAARMASSSSGANHRISGSRRNHVSCRLA